LLDLEIDKAIEEVARSLAESLSPTRRPAPAHDAEPVKISMAGDVARIDGAGEGLRVMGNAVEVLVGDA